MCSFVACIDYTAKGTYCNLLFLVSDTVIKTPVRPMRGCYGHKKCDLEIALVKKRLCYFGGITTVVTDASVGCLTNKGFDALRAAFAASRAALRAACAALRAACAASLAGSTGAA